MPVSWARFDDLYDDHPKVMAVMHECPTAAAIHPQAITASARRESDGLVDPFWLLSRVPDKKRRAEALSALVRNRLFDELPAGEQLSLSDDKGFAVTVGPFKESRHVVHDFLDYNPSSAQLQERRRKDAERKAKGRHPESDGSPDGHDADSAGSPSPVRGSAGAGPQPGPDPVPTPREEANASSTSRVARELFAYWQAVCRHQQAKPSGERMRAVKARLKDGYGEERIRKAIDGAAKSPYVNPDGKVFDDLELICRTGAKLEDFEARADAQPASNVAPFQRPGTQTPQDFLDLRGQLG